jgi:hypothetical protein
MPDLTDFQREVTRLFFSLPASKGFLLCTATSASPGPGTGAGACS